MFGRIVSVFDKAMTFFENWTLFLCVMVGLISLLANVILRYGFNYSLAWSEELIREIIMYTTFIGCSAAIKRRNMIVIDVLPQSIPRLKKPLAFFSHLATMIFAVLITYLGVQMAVQQHATFQTTVILKIPMYLLYVMLPLMGVLMGLRTVQAVYEDVRTFFLTPAEKA